MLMLWLVSTMLGVGDTCPTAAARVAKDRYAKADYQGAIAALAELEVCPDGTEPELADALRWRAQAKASIGDTAGAIDSWALAWTVLPTFVLDPLESPKFHDLYAEGRKRAAKGQSVFARLTRTLGGRAVVQVYDPSGRVRRVAVLFDHIEINAPRREDGLYQAIVPEGAVAACAVLESGDAVIYRSLKVMLAELPSPPDDLALKRSPPLDRQKVITIAGVAVAAVAVAVVISAIALGAKHIDGSLGRVELP